MGKGEPNRLDKRLLGGPARPAQQQHADSKRVEADSRTQAAIRKRFHDGELRPPRPTFSRRLHDLPLYGNAP
jgi:hypothetical protein